MMGIISTGQLLGKGEWQEQETGPLTASQSQTSSLQKLVSENWASEQFCVLDSVCRSCKKRRHGILGFTLVIFAAEAHG